MDRYKFYFNDMYKVYETDITTVQAVYHDRVIARKGVKTSRRVEIGRVENARYRSNCSKRN